jgi:uncharacterized ferritin-like protein (DUF455 family)
VDNLYHQAKSCFLLSDPDEKLAKTLELVEGWRSGGLEWREGEKPQKLNQPGRLERPEIVKPRELNRRRTGKVEGRAAMIHAMAHIELTAVNLAWDNIYRYRDMPRAFYDDWVQTAGEESTHFFALRDCMRELGFDYGDFPVHNGLWEMALSTADDLMHRMAIVHRVLEARALDVVPKTIKKFAAMGDAKMVSTLTMIVNDEVGHVNAGTRWFHYRCEQEKLAADETFFSLVKHYLHGPLKGPFNRELRLQAGFSENEIDQLQASVREHSDARV